MSDTAATTAPTQPADSRLPAAEAFIERLKALDRGELSALRRNAGNTFAEARDVAWFFRTLDQDGRGRDMEVYFLVATLFALSKRAGGGDFGRTMAALKARPGTSPEAVDRRFRILLDAQFDRTDGNRPSGGELAYRLRQLVKLTASKEVGIHWPQLLLDLRDWSYPQKRVQRRWAESFYAPPHRADTDAPAEENATQE